MFWGASNSLHTQQDLVFSSHICSPSGREIETKCKLTILIPCPEYKEMILIALLETNIAIEHCLQDGAPQIYIGL